MPLSPPTLTCQMQATLGVERHVGVPLADPVADAEVGQALAGGREPRVDLLVRVGQPDVAILDGDAPRDVELGRPRGQDIAIGGDARRHGGRPGAPATGRAGVRIDAGRADPGRGTGGIRVVGGRTTLVHLTRLTTRSV